MKCDKTVSNDASDTTFVLSDKKFAKYIVEQIRIILFRMTLKNFSEIESTLWFKKALKNFVFQYILSGGTFLCPMLVFFSFSGQIGKIFENP